jgi:hypothetical protein
MSEQPDLAALIAQLEAERAEMDVTIALLRRRMGMSPANGDTPAASSSTSAMPSAGRDTIITGRVRPDEFFRLSIADAIAKLLSIMKQPQSPASIVSGLKAGGVLTNAKNFPANVNTELKRMRERGTVVNTPSGWGLAEWYPGRPKQNEAPKGKKKTRVRAKVAAKPAAKSTPKVRVRPQPSAKPTPSGEAASADTAPAPPEAAPQSIKSRNGQRAWRAFAAEQIHGGKSMAEAAAAWKERKAASEE